MSACEDEYLDEEVEAYIEFNEEGWGSFHFGYVRGIMDHYRTKIRDGKRVVQFCWDGGDAQMERRWTALDGQFSTATR